MGTGKSASTTKSMRCDPDVRERFEKFAADAGLTDGKALDALLQIQAEQAAKEENPEITGLLEEFNSSILRCRRIFYTVVDFWHDATKRAQEEVQQEVCNLQNSVKSLQNYNSRLEKERNDAMEAVSGYRNQIASLQTDVQNFQHILDGFQSQIQTQDAVVAELAAARKKAEETMEEIRQRNQKLTTETENLKNELRSSQELHSRKLQEKDDRIAELQAQLSKATSPEEIALYAVKFRDAFFPQVSIQTEKADGSGADTESAGKETEAATSGETTTPGTAESAHQENTVFA